MADLDLTDSDRASADPLVVDTVSQLTLPAAVALDPLTPVHIDANGKFAKADADVQAVGDQVFVTLRKAAAGEPVTAVKRGVVDGLDVSALAYGARVYLSNNAGRIADAAGTNSITVGIVVPRWNLPLGSSPDKVLQLTLQ